MFDRHRVGRHAYTYQEGLRLDPPQEDGRRCLSVNEMEQLNWELDQKGRWYDPVLLAATREAFNHEG